MLLDAYFFHQLLSLSFIKLGGGLVVSIGCPDFQRGSYGCICELTCYVVFVDGHTIVDIKRKKERNPLQKDHLKDIGFTVGETILSLSPILGDKKPN